MTKAGVCRRGAALGLVLLAACSAGGCGGPGAEPSPAGVPASGDSPSPTATSPAELCTRIIAYWSRRALKGDTYGDYQSMGLSDGQYEILRAVVDEARAERERAGDAAAGRIVDRRARAACEKRYRDGGPTGGPWG
ncbi:MULTISPECIES: hypothetical protein [unclassified Streptomyces]|uniref:hypothetical protein n=1 Tax=unclassified Streptomyces TaxID=2593676 RepID=UPI00074886D1|nr:MULTISPECIES: hypothetical protein [unclassified Streptomyces]KUL68501.1 hypothetical protein ADL33_33505 [Streptomyces sp. NRRL WC-3604]KUL69237.1 hypothetical protein ADL34_31085 [Streptomyces sp. NRRL WC-3605]